MRFRRAIVPAALIAATAFSVASPAANSEVPLDEITVSATKIATPLLDVPAAVTVITNDDIERRIDGDIKDLVRYEPNVSVRNNVARFGLADFNVRGIQGNRVLIELDNVRIADAFSIGSFSNSTRDGIDLDLLKRVEIVRGSASSLYGSDAIGGVVSLTTKDPIDLLGDERSFSFGARGTYGEAHEGYGGSASLAARSGRFSGLAVYTHQESGDYENQGTNAALNGTRTVPNPQEGYGDGILLKGVFNASDTQLMRLTLESSRHDQFTDLISSRTVTPTLDTTRLTGDDEDERRRISFEHEFSVESRFLDGGVWRVYDQRSETHQYTTENRTVRAGPTTTLRVRERVFDFTQELTGGEATLHKTWDLKAGSHRLTFGLEYLDTHTVQQRGGIERNLTTGTATSQVGPDLYPVRDFPISDTRASGVYLQDELRLGRWIVTPGVRFDCYELTPHPDSVFVADNPGVTPARVKDENVSPKLGVVFRPRDTLAIFASYNYGFRAPPYADVNVGFTNLAAGYTTVPNPDLEPESSDNFEAGVKYSVEGLRFDFSAFYNTYQDFIQSFATIGTNPQGLLVFQSQNLNSVRIYGAEAKATVPFGRVTWQSAIGYSRGTDRETNQPLDTIDPMRIVTGLDYQPVTGKWSSGIAVTWVDSKSQVDPATSQFQPENYLTVDLYGELRLGDHMRLNVGFYNATNEKYWDWADVRGRPATDVAIDRYTRPGRTFSASLKVEF